ncbi:HAD-IIIC family phosphatase [Streptomyces sp. NPDC002125]
MVKCLVWDLDNTLWQGTLLEGDDVRVSDEVRELIATLDSRGILQAVASKNDHDLAWAKLEAMGLAEFFVVPRIGWGPKSDSVRLIAERLKFAEGAIAFIDDQPAERAEVAFHLPLVRCYATEQLPSLADLPEFSPDHITIDSRRRRQMYRAGFQREAEQAAFEGPDQEFLRSLELTLRIDRATEEQLTRVEELTLRTSQMNATGVHYSDAALRGLLADPGHEVLVATMADRFGPHGAIGVMLLSTHPGVWHLKLLATSCRVVSFGAGAALLNWLIDQAAQAGAHLAADFLPTERNRMMEIAYRFAGFTEASEEPCGCLAALPEVNTGDLQRLHLVSGAREEHPTIEISAPDLAGFHGVAAGEPAR